jgi:hypothetical protein
MEQLVAGAEPALLAGATELSYRCLATALDDIR